MVLGVGGRGGTEDFASSTNRGVATPPDTSAVTSSGGGGGSNKPGAVSVAKESKPFELSAKTHHQDSHSQVRHYPHMIFFQKHKGLGGL